WKLDLDKQQLSVFAGTGMEARADGTRDEAAFAQPSGLATDGRVLYVADAESNTIRAVSLDAEARSNSKTDGAQTKADAQLKTASLSSSGEGDRTLAGGDLFDFGDRDGAGDDVRLQHPLGLALYQNQLFIADTYNHKIKVLDPRARTVKTFAGTGKPGQADGAQPSFYEPGGLAVARSRLYVADTNNHAVRVVDIATKQTVTLVIRGLQPPAQSTDANAAEADGDADPRAEALKLAPQQLAASGDAALVVDVALPAGYHLNPSAPQRYKVSVEGGGERLALVGGDAKVLSTTAKDMRLPLRLPLRALAQGAASLRVRLTLYYYREDNTGP